ncbi:MAG: NAD-dependent epimerase/dehydratase family protein [Crocinitomicaceae bacterium]|nr:NAD-dependent epimerase/dehydratase family protein [Crocinitomicaceae bacterium]
MILVTGGTGLLGSHLLFKLSNDKTPIKAIYRSDKKREQVRKVFEYYDPENGVKRFESIAWCKGNILDIPSIDEAMEECEYVYHCAALVSFHRKDFNYLLKINREGTFNIVNACLAHGIKKLCYVSSTAAIGGNDNELITENSKWKNSPTTSGYSISKYSAEKEVWRGIEEGLDAVMVNPCVIVGAGNWNDSSLTLFRTLQNGVKYFPPGSNAIVDARDVVEIMHRLMLSNITAERYLCIGSNQSFKELMEVIAKQLGVKAPNSLAARWKVELARVLLSLASLFSGKRSSMTRATINSLFGKRSYSSQKVCDTLDFKFRSLDESIENSVKGRIS